MIQEFSGQLIEDGGCCLTIVLSKQNEFRKYIFLTRWEEMTIKDGSGQKKYVGVAPLLTGITLFICKVDDNATYIDGDSRVEAIYNIFSVSEISLLFRCSAATRDAYKDKPLALLEWLRNA